MNMKRVSLGGLVVALLCLGGVRGEDMPTPYAGAHPGDAAPASPPPGAVADAAAPTPWTNNWLAYPRCLGCCGPVGGNGPIGYEAYVRSGLNFPLGGNPFGARMETGWTIAVGARTLFFNPESDAAWTVDLGVMNVYDRTRDHSTFRLFNVRELGTNTTVPEVDVQICDLNRTYVNLSGGREWYLMGCANGAQPDVNWRVGVDLGGRFGTEKLDVTNFRHRTDINSGVFMAVHSDLEIPWGCCLFLAGVRGEYGYTWSDVLQRQNNSDVEDINLLFNLGLRF